MVEHIQDDATYQHLDDVRVDVGWRNLGVVQELFEERRKRKMEPRVELFLAKEDRTLGCLFGGRRIPIH